MDTAGDDLVTERAAADAAAMPDCPDVRRAADLLPVSPQYAAGLTDRGELAAGGTGAARRANRQDALAWLRRSMVLRRRALDELVRETEALGPYDDPPRPPSGRGLITSPGRYAHRRFQQTDNAG